MNPRFFFLPFGLAAAVYLAPTDARACGGCIYGPTLADAGTSQQNPSVVTDHRMVLSVSPEMTTLWDQIEYAGSPDQFAWVLPIRGAVTVGLGSDAFIDALDKITTPRVVAPQVFCNPPPPPPGPPPGSSGDYDYSSSSSCGCSAMSSADTSPGTSLATDTAFGGGLNADGGVEDEGVTVTERKAVGPYETVQISGDSTESILTWLRKNKYTIPTDVEPILTKYVSEKYDFLAVRLAPSADVNAMKPIRVSWRGAYPMLPLRMVAAGVGEQVGIKLFVIGDGRWKAKNFFTFTINDADLIWDFKIGRSNYTTLRADRAGAQDLHAFALETSIDVSGYSLPGRDSDSPDGGLAMDTGVSDAAEAGDADETSEADIDGAIDTGATDTGPTDTGPTDTGPTDTGPTDTGPTDTGPSAPDAKSPPMISPYASDVEIAYGTKSSLRVTRLRADLPKRHLNTDLELEADDDQSLVPVRRAVSRQTGAESLCPFGVSSVQASASPLLAEQGGPTRPQQQNAACAISNEARSPVKMSMLAVVGLAAVGLLRKLRRRR